MVKVEVDGKIRDMKVKGTIKDILSALDLNVDDYVAVLNGEVVTEHEPFAPDDTVKFVRVWSGG